MSTAPHALEYLAAPEKASLSPVMVVWGDDSFLQLEVLRTLKHRVLGDDDGAFSLSTFDGTSADLRDVLDELSTVALFGGGGRLVIVENADEFISRHRSALEGYVEHPRGTSTLVLAVASWPKNTRLYKAHAQRGTLIECTAPQERQLGRWLVEWARQRHQVKLEKPAAERLVELVGPLMGLLDQELAKLSASAGEERSVSLNMVDALVGTWRTKTTWEMLDAALDGDAAKALTQLDRLLLAGENEIALLGQMAASLRRLAAATQRIEELEATGKKPNLRQALIDAGVKSFAAEKSERHLRRLGRRRGSRLSRWILQTDLALKGASHLPPRTVLEQFLVRLAAPAEGTAVQRR